MNIGRHPAPGLGELQPGWFVVPQNPMDGPVSYVRGIGDILATGGYSVPQNPVAGFNSGQVQPIGVAPGVPGTINNKPVSAGVGCGCAGDSCGCGSGMGDISTELTQLSTDLTAGNYTNALINDTLFSVPVWGYVALLGVFMFAGGEGHSYASRGRRAAKAARGAF